VLKILRRQSVIVTVFSEGDTSPSVNFQVHSVWGVNYTLASKSNNKQNAWQALDGRKITQSLDLRLIFQQVLLTWFIQQTPDPR